MDEEKECIMKKAKQFFAVLLAISFIQVMVMPTFAVAGQAEMEYNPILGEMGISKEIFEGMPPEKKAIYQDYLSIGDSVSDTRYFKEIGVLSADGTIERTMIETTKEAYENRVEENIIQPYGINSDTDTVYETWCTMETTITLGIKIDGNKAYTVHNKLDIDIYKMSQGIAVFDRSALIAISHNNNMSAIPGSEYFRMDYTYLTGSQAGKPGYEEKFTAPYKSSIGYAFDFRVDNNKRNHKVEMMYLAEPNTSNVTIADAFGSACFWAKVVTVNSVVFGSSGLETVGITSNDKCFYAKNTHVQVR